MSLLFKLFHVDCCCFRNDRGVYCGEFSVAKKLVVSSAKPAQSLVAPGKHNARDNL